LQIITVVPVTAKG